MGGRAYLARLALGRSAYEPLDVEEVLEDAVTTEQMPPGRVQPQRDQGGTTISDHQAHSSGQYVQQFDDRGHPQNLTSRALSRLSRRAQNDVLATVGIVMGPDQGIQGAPVLPTQPSDDVEEQRFDETEKDTEDGFLIEVPQLLAFIYIHNRMTSLRNRLQTFPFYAGVPFPEILKTEWALSSPLLLLFGGLPGDVLFMLLRNIRPSRRSHRLYNKAVHQKLATINSPSLRCLLISGAAIIELCHFVCCCSVMTSLGCHSILQGLGILPLRPFFPSLRALVPFTPASITQPISLPSHFITKFGLQFLASLATSPIIFYCSLTSARSFLYMKIFTCLRLALPKPDNPDLTSAQVAASRKEDNKSIPGLGFKWNEEDDLFEKDVGTVRELVQQDWTVFNARFQSMTGWFRFLVMRICRSPNSLVVYQGCSRGGRNLFNYALREPPEPPQEQHVSEQCQDSSPECDLCSHIRSNPSSHNLHGSPQATQGQQAPGIPPDPSLEAESRPPDDEPPSGHGLHDQQPPEEFNEGNAAGLESPLCQSSEDLSVAMVNSLDLYASPGCLIDHDPTSNRFLYHDDSRPTHRVTLLTNIVADTMAANLATLFTHVLFLPLETLLVRSVALAYLNSAGGSTDSSRWLRSEMYPLGSWFGMGLRGGRAMDYAWKMALCLGVEMALGYGVWQVGAGAAWWLGRKTHRWGRL